MVQQVKNSPAMQETQEMWVWSLGWEDPLGNETATHSNILAWEIPWTGKSGGLQRIRHDWVTTHTNTQIMSVYIFTAVYTYLLWVLKKYKAYLGPMNFFTEVLFSALRWRRLGSQGTFEIKRLKLSLTGAYSHFCGFWVSNEWTLGEAMLKGP